MFFHFFAGGGALGVLPLDTHGAIGTNLPILYAHGSKYPIVIFYQYHMMRQLSTAVSRSSCGGGGGRQSSILTSFLKSTGLFTIGVKFASKSVQPLQRYCNLQMRSKEGMENLYLGNPSYLMT